MTRTPGFDAPPIVVRRFSHSTQPRLPDEKDSEGGPARFRRGSGHYVPTFVLRARPHPRQGPGFGRAPAPPAPLPVVTCDGVEITQVIQHMDHSVPLIAGKETVVRVYLSLQGPSPILVRGELSVSEPAGTVGGLATVTSISTVGLNPALNGNIKAKRLNLGLSLNFRIPAGLTTVGSREFALTQLLRADTGDALVVPPQAKRIASFEQGVPLRVRVLGIRFQGSGPGTLEPTDLDFELIRSWLGRAYPTPSVEWSRATVDGPKSWPFDADDINAFLRAVRFQDVQGGVDQRTHYYGVVADGGAGAPYFMRGKASAVPGSPDPSAVASGPTGVPSGSFGWDTDGSYGDWYAGHELGHTFGRPHAEFCGAVDGAPYPFPNGQLSDNDKKYVGLDVGDAAHSIPPQALPGTIWHDVMTYCTFEWPSSFTYEGIKACLAVEAGLAPAPAPPSVVPHAAAGPPGAPVAAGPAGTVHVVAKVNLTQRTGTFQQVQPYPGLIPPPNRAPTGRGDEAHLALNLRDAQNRLLAAIPAPFFPNVCGRARSRHGDRRTPEDRGAVPAAAPPEPAAVGEENRDEIGLVDAKLPLQGAASRIELVLGEKILDSFERGPQPAPVTNIRVVEPPAAARAALPSGPPALAEAPVRRHPVITWDTTTDRAAALAAEPGPPNRYSVQLSTDEGHTWQTIGMGLQKPQVTVDRNLLAGIHQVRLRVTATDGFQARVQEREFAASEL